jgi:hypothetical protein
MRNSMDFEANGVALTGFPSIGEWLRNRRRGDEVEEEVMLFVPHKGERFWWLDDLDTERTAR